MSLPIPLRHVFLATAFLGATSPAATRAQTIPKGSFFVDLQPFATLPNSGGNLPARASVLTSAPDGRTFANDQRGLLYLLGADGASVTLYLNVAARTPLLNDNGERGFHSFAFHPDFNTPGTAGYGKLYTLASQTDTSAPATFAPNVPGAGRDHDEVLLEWTAADPAAATFTPADPARPFREVLRLARPAGNHNAGYLAFNPTAGNGPDRDNLYFGTGDSGGGGDPLNLAQMAGGAFGAILRINPLLPAAGDPRRSANGQYRIPADNPFTTNRALLPEKFAGGFRNPQRFTWDPANGHLFIADIGQNRVEEIDLAVPGANYGWNQREGSFVYQNGNIGNNARGDAAATGFTYPVAEYFHFGSAGNGVTAGPVLRDGRFPGLGTGGRLLFADFPTGGAYTIDADQLPNGGQEPISELRLRQNGVESSFLDMIRQVNPSAGRADLRFGTDAVGDVYFLNKQDGIIRRVVATPAAVTAPTVSVSVDVATLSRGAGQVATVSVSRVGDTTRTSRVLYTLGGALVNGQDYAALSGAVKIKPGQASATVTLRPLPGGRNGKITLTVQAGGKNYAVGNPAKVKVRVGP